MSRKPATGHLHSSLSGSAKLKHSPEVSRPGEQLELLDPAQQPLFANELPIPERIDASRPGAYVLQMRHSEQWLGLVDADGNPLTTTVWGYGQPGQPATYPGPTIVAYEGIAIKLNWQNKLPLLGHLLPVDTTLHWAESEKKPLSAGYVPTVTHLHGGHSPSGSDGLPEAWFTQNYSSKGPDFQDRIYTYPNDQQAATLWYHDHALGITRLNVYAGLAGFYLLQDENSQTLARTGVLPSGPYSARSCTAELTRLGGCFDEDSYVGSCWGFHRRSGRQAPRSGDTSDVHRGFGGIIHCAHPLRLAR